MATTLDGYDYETGTRTGEAAKARFASRLQHVLEVLLVEPVTVGRSGSSGKDVALTLQHLPRRQAYVRVGTATYAMQTLPLGDRVDAEEEQRRVRQLQEQTRRALCRHVSELDPPVVREVSEVPGAGAGDERPTATIQPETRSPESDAPRADKTTRIRRSRPLP